MPFAPLDLLLALAPTSALLALSWALRRLVSARPRVDDVAVGARKAPERDRHGELVPAYARADA